jgi:hypothetical protein
MVNYKLVLLSGDRIDVKISINWNFNINKSILNFFSIFQINIMENQTTSIFDIRWISLANIRACLIIIISILKFLFLSFTIGMNFNVINIGKKFNFSYFGKFCKQIHIKTSKKALKHIIVLIFKPNTNNTTVNLF